jgi:hypothetical protein
VEFCARASGTSFHSGLPLRRPHSGQADATSLARPNVCSLCSIQTTRVHQVPAQGVQEEGAGYQPNSLGQLSFFSQVLTVVRDTPKVRVKPRRLLNFLIGSQNLFTAFFAVAFPHWVLSTLLTTPLAVVFLFALRRKTILDQLVAATGVTRYFSLDPPLTYHSSLCLYPSSDELKIKSFVNRCSIVLGFLPHTPTLITLNRFRVPRETVHATGKTGCRLCV